MRLEYFLLFALVACKTTDAFKSSYGTNEQGHRYSFEEEDPNKEYKKHNISRAVSNKCPMAPKFAEYINNPRSVPSQCGEINKDVMEQISTIPQAGGYSVGGTATNVPLRMGQDKVTGVGSTSFCSGATFTVAMKVFNKHRAFDGMTETQKANFKFGLSDNYGFWGAWNNNYGGVGDANRLVSFGKDIDSLSDACPGDFLKYSRTNRRAGHSVIYLGSYEDKIYYWSSNKSTNGFGVTCEAESNLIKSGLYKPSIVRMTHPNNIQNIENYTGNNYVNYYKEQQNVPSNRGINEGEGRTMFVDFLRNRRGHDEVAI